jgi:hypothetical protein
MAGLNPRENKTGKLRCNQTKSNISPYIMYRRHAHVWRYSNRTVHSATLSDNKGTDYLSPMYNLGQVHSLRFADRVHMLSFNRLTVALSSDKNYDIDATQLVMQYKCTEILGISNYVSNVFKELLNGSSETLNHVT